MTKKKKLSDKIVLLIVVLVLIAGTLWWWRQGRDLMYDTRFSDVEAAPYREANSQAISWAETYYNDYLGIKYKLQKGWWLYELAAKNMVSKKNRAQSSDPEALEIVNMGSEHFLDLISVGNKRYSDDSGHISIDLTAEKNDEAQSITEYMVKFDEFMTNPEYMGSTYRIVNKGEEVISGRVWTTRLYSVDEDGDSYRNFSLVTEVKNGYFLAASANYWPENSNATREIIAHLKAKLTIER